MKPKILILGGNFAGLHAAFELHHTLGNEAEVTVVAPEDYFVFLPSLIWVVTGKCPPKRIQFDLRAALEPCGIHFAHQHVTRVDVTKNLVHTDMGTLGYDFLVVATGADPDWDAVPGMGPHGGHTHYVCSVPWATHAARAWQKLLADPGPVVVGAAASTGCFGLGYEMVFNLECSLRKAGASKHSKAPITFITSEPFVGHLGMGGVGNVQSVIEGMFKKRGIEWVTNADTKEITDDEIRLSDGRSFPYKYALYLAPFKGRKYIFDSPGLGNEKGFIPVNDRYQHVKYPNVYGAGVAIAVQQPEKTPVPIGVPKTGYMSDVMGKVAAKNIEAEIMGKHPKDLPFADINLICVMDAGDEAVALISERVFNPRKRAYVYHGALGHLGKIMFEKYYMWKVRHGMVYLP
jgi:sulfide:quinone oxidoreductase